MIGIFLGCAIITVLSADIPFASDSIVIDRFSSAVEKTGIPAGWEELNFPKIKKHTIYTVEKDDGNYFLKAVSHGSASGIYRKMTMDIREYRLLSWRWKVANVLENGDGRTKAGDDYAARIYITFRFEPERSTFMERIKRGIVRTLYGVEVPGNTINYIWANRIGRGRMLPNAYTNDAMMIAVESGRSKTGMWVDEEVDIYSDYKKAFGSEPPLVTSIAVMTDTDNTGENAVAFYDDIVFKKR